MRLCSTALVALAVSGLLAVPSIAAARRFHIPQFKRFRVIYRGRGSYGVNLSGEGVAAQEKATFRWKVTYAPLLIVERLHAAVGTAARRKASSGAGEWSISSDNGEERCQRSGGLKLASGGGITGRVAGSRSVDLTLVPGNDDFTTTNPSGGYTACDTESFWQDWVMGFSHIGSGGEEVLDPLTAFVHLDRADLRRGKTIFAVSGARSALAAPGLAPNPDCGSGDGTTCKQSFDWSGHVTLRRIGHSRRHHRR